ncbi:MAG: hypothetical protein ACI8Q1_000257 [Parvicella sp.]|jgi:hypothetical protein
MKGFEVDFMHDSLDRVSSSGDLFSISDIIDHMALIKNIGLGLSYMTIRTILLREINVRISEGLVISPSKGKYLLVMGRDVRAVKLAKSLRAVSDSFLGGVILEEEFVNRVGLLSSSLSSNK